MTKIKFSKTKVVTRNVVLDIFAKVRNFFGMNLVQYEDMINKTVEELHKEIETEYKTIFWFRQQIDQLSSEGVMITIYGEGEK